MKLTHFLPVAAALALAACSHSNSWKVEGTVEGAEAGVPLILEASASGRWYPLDTVSLPASGRFSFAHEAAGYPDIYRLRMADRSLYFPIDSIETVTVSARADAFDSDYTLAGSPSAESLMAVDRMMLEAAKSLGVEAAASDSAFKRSLANTLLADPSGIVAYYIINKRIGGRPLFDPTNKLDLRIIGAVANAYSEKRPDDPRTAYLTRLFKQNYAASAVVTYASSDTITAPEVGLLDINLYDEQGTLRSLADVASKGNPVILNFTVYSAEGSPALNMALNKIYERYRSRGLEIYQVGFDDDEYAWRQSARNLPWTTVFNSPTDGARLLMRYNVGSLPASFLIDSDGSISRRITDLDSFTL